MLEKLLEKRKAFLTRTMERCRSWLMSAPSGTMRVSCRKYRKTAYYHYPDSDKNERTRLSPIEDAKLIKNLAVKDYYEKIIPETIRELSIINELLSESQNLASVYEKLHPERQKLVNPIEVTKEKATENWNRAVDTHPADPRPGNYYIPTKRGELVRSKAEYNIANELFDHGIPYKYEYSFESLNGTVLHPDFYVRNKSTGECFFWEHFGMMDDPKYVRNSFLNKLNLYASNDIYIGHGLIATFSGFGNDLDIKTIRRIIKAFLL